MKAIRVLMAEDEALAAEALEEALAEAGFEVLSAADGLAALGLADGHAFDVLLTDLRMPGMDGRELILHLRRRWPGLPVVVMTGYDMGAGEAALEGGPGPFRLLAKPLQIDGVIAALIEVAGGGSLQPRQP